MGIKSCINKINQDVHIYYIDMPCTISSNVVECDDGSYTIYINSRLSYECQLQGIKHELKHILRNDLEYCENVNYTELCIRKDDNT